MIRPTTVAAFLILAAALAGTPARAQRFEGSIGVHKLAYRYRDPAVTDRQTGLFLGASGSALLGAVRFRLQGMIGRLAAGEALPSRSLRSTSLGVGLQATRWLEVGVEGVARREAVDTAVVLQRMGGIYTRATSVFGTEGFQGVIELAVYPARGATNVDPINVALRGGIGARYAPPGSWLMLELGYRLFRLDHRNPTGIVSLEQDEALVFQVGLRR